MNLPGELSIHSMMLHWSEGEGRGKSGGGMRGADVSQ